MKKNILILIKNKNKKFIIKTNMETKEKTKIKNKEFFIKKINKY